MRTFPYTSIAILALILLLIDAYAYKGWKKLTWPLPAKWLRVLVGIYWLHSAAFIVSMLWLSYGYRSQYSPELHIRASYLFGWGLATGIPKIIFILFHGAEDLIHFLNTISKKIFRTESVGMPGVPIDRATFLTKTGLAISAVPFIGINYGILRGRFDFRVLRETIIMPNLPEAFNGVKIIQISDLHIGSFDHNYDAVKVGVEMANREEGDYLFFTGDLVNNFARETDGWFDVLRQLEAKNGMMSILGNHDYGDYSQWDKPEHKEENFLEVQEANREIGFDLLMNEHRILERNGQRIAVIGVENWGKPPFHQYGDLTKAAEGLDGDIPFRILLSHDPSHWDMQVLGKTSIDLTLSGHTHGAQFGVEAGNFKWSPVQYKYPRWAGLYKEGDQYLYVNRGFGFLGFPGRVGMPPEITVIELRNTV